MQKVKTRIPELDGIRVLLVFIVSWYHIWQQSWLTPYIGSTSLDFLVRSGYVHVDGTILLSGFLLFLPYARSMLLGEAMPSTRRFYQRRAMRIMPSYYFLIVVVFFAIALPYGLYASPQFMVKDIVTHLTFTFTFSADTYMSTPLGAACWTLAIELQAYILFPFLAKSAMKRPVLTLLGMTLVAAAFRAYCLWALSDFAMVVNQLPSFLDVYAIGMAASMLCVWLQKRWDALRHKPLWEVAATVVVALCIWGYVAMLKIQAGSGSYVNIQRGQMLHRPLFALSMAGLMLSLPFALKPIRFLFNNRLMQGLAAISMNYYLIHQVVAVHLRRIGFPPSISDTPNRVSEQPWQWQYTLCAFGFSLILAIAVTLLIERPCARALKRAFAQYDKRRNNEP